MNEIDELDAELEAARREKDPIKRNSRVFDAEQKRYRAQKRQFEQSLKRRAAIQKARGST